MTEVFKDTFNFQTTDDHSEVDFRSTTDLENITECASTFGEAGRQSGSQYEEEANKVYSNYNFRHEYDDRLAITKHREEVEYISNWWKSKIILEIQNLRFHQDPMFTIVLKSLPLDP
jgi:hypothetical protein